MRLPELAVVNVFNAVPGLRRPALLLPADAEMAIVEAAHLRREPGRHVNAIGDVADGNGVFGPVGIESLPHGARNFAVQAS